MRCLPQRKLGVEKWVWVAPGPSPRSELAQSESFRNPCYHFVIFASLGRISSSGLASPLMAHSWRAYPHPPCLTYRHLSPSPARHKAPIPPYSGSETVPRTVTIPLPFYQRSLSIRRAIRHRLISQANGNR